MASKLSTEVSIIIRTTPERSGFLERSLSSVNGQKTDYRIEAVVVCDGGKTDRTGELCASFPNIDIRYVPTNEPCGRSHAANIALDSVTGEAVGFLDDDDIFYDNHVEVLSKELFSGEAVDAVYAGAEEVARIVESVNPLRTCEQSSRVFLHPINDSYDLLGRNPFPIQSVLFRKVLLKEDTRFVESLHVLEDWHFWQQLLIGRSIRMIDQVTSRFFVPADPREIRERRKIHESGYEEFYRLSDQIRIELKILRSLYNEMQHQKKWMPPTESRSEQPRSLLAKAMYVSRNPQVLARKLDSYLQGRRQRRARTVGVTNFSSKTLSAIERLHKLSVEDSRPLVREGATYGRKTVVYTSVNRAYLAKALLLGESLKKHNSSVEFHILYADVIDQNIERIFDRYHFVDCVYPLAALEMENRRPWIFMRNVVELCTGIKPVYLEHLLEKGCDRVVYIDPDCRVFNSIEAIERSIDDHSLSLTPHCDEVGRSDAQIRTNELSSLAHGVFNLGYIGVKNDSVGRSVANYWRSRVDSYGFDEIQRGMFTDQKPFDFAPIFFPGMDIVRHKGINVASWNIESRPISEQGGQYYAGEEQLIFFHFSGYDKGVPGEVARRLSISNDVLQGLFDDYERDLVSLQADIEFGEPWPLGQYDNGSPILDAHRICYRGHKDLQEVFPDPHHASDARTFYSWIQHRGAEYIRRKYDRSRWLPRFY
jgi:glycosyltransferase involved in cell wall biosynthesis